MQHDQRGLKPSSTIFSILNQCVENSSEASAIFLSYFLLEIRGNYRYIVTVKDLGA